MYSRSLGDTESWLGYTATTDNVYVWRAYLSGASPFNSVEDLQVFAAAVGAAPKTFGSSDNRALSVKGATISQDGKVLDVVMMSPEWHQYIFQAPTTPMNLAHDVLNDPAVRARHPGLSIDNAEWLYLTGPPLSVDFWKAAPTIYDHNIGPTQAMADRKNLLIGSSEDGQSARQFKNATIPIDTGGHTTPPVEPPASQAQPSKYRLALLLGTVAVAWIGVKSLLTGRGP